MTVINKVVPQYNISIKSAKLIAELLKSYILLKIFTNIAAIELYKITEPKNFYN